MKAAMIRMASVRGGGKILASAGIFAALLASIATFAGEALAQSADCARLQQAIAARRGSSGAEAAVERQRSELGRTEAYARSLGCGNRKILFFGSDPPPQCADLSGQIARMQASLAELQARAGGGAGDLIARYNAECLGAPRPTNFLEALFGGVARLGAPPPPAPGQMDARYEPVERADRTTESGQPVDKEHVVAHSGSYAVCVRTCDGSFFPVSYTGAGSRADSLEEVCRALCPNTDVALYSFPFGGTIDEAASSSGEPYSNLPNSGKFQTTYDPNCSCRRKGQSWAEALADAEARYGHEKRDIIVTPEKSLEMSRPIVDPKAKPGASAVVAGPGATPSSDAANAPVLDVNGTDTKLSAETATVSREASGIAGDDVQGAKSFSVKQGRTVEETGPDGVKRIVRIVGPTL